MIAKLRSRLDWSYLSADTGVGLEDYTVGGRKHLAPHKVPQRWYVASELPKTPTGKVRKFALPDLIAQGIVRELFREEPDQ
jgi:fatty-acyl-CoA synthase